MKPHLPPLGESIDYIRQLGKPTVAEVLGRADAQRRVLVQPRCGVGDHEQMRRLLRELEQGARPEILTITIDSHTRLKKWDAALRVLNTDPGQLNGYPLVTHGWQRGRELNESVRAPLQIRHGSPDPGVLFDTSLACGITAFEGGGIGYNLPYCKTVPIADSLAAWREVDRTCGRLAAEGVIVDRELFGTLTAVLMPPSISLAMTLLEAISAAQDRVGCLSIAYPQSGHVWQDVAALRCVRRLSGKYLPPGTVVFPVLHQFMGVFPWDRQEARSLVAYGGLIARMGGAVKVITKTADEAYGIPTTEANLDGMLTARLMHQPFFDFIPVDEAAVSEEMEAIEREVADLIEPLLSERDLHPAIVRAFAAGRLDIPFAASRYTRSAVIPVRDSSGAIRFLDHGELPFQRATLARNEELVRARRDGAPTIDDVVAGIYHFCRTARPAG
jgi:methylaspartate mutase epsilon subunit